MPTNFRIGFGYDIHAFCKGDHVVLGGVKIPYKQGLSAHSDGDVLIHAVCDALLGAAALGDIGTHFPNNDPAYSNISSMILLERTTEKITNAGYSIVNIDASLIAESPKVSNHYSEMRDNLASRCKISTDAVSVKATTNEKLGSLGKGEGIAAMAVAMLIRSQTQSLV